MEPDQVTALAGLTGPLVERAGLYCESVELTGGGASRRLVVTVDLPEDELGGVSLDKIAEVTRDISAGLDEAGIIAGPYRLEVSTPGVGRPLSEPRHFKRARTRLVRLTLHDGSQLTGRLREADGEGITLVSGEGERRLPYGEIRRGKVQVEFKEPPRDVPGQGTGPLRKGE